MEITQNMKNVYSTNEWKGEKGEKGERQNEWQSHRGK